MQLSFKTRQSAREFNAKRHSKGLQGKVVDHGKEFKQAGLMSRYAVTLR